MVYIYGLYSNVENEIRYVGKTTNVEKRLYEHLGDASRNNKTHKHKWINKVLNTNGEVKIVVLEKCGLENWEEREKYWINHHGNLTNHTNGGEGGHGLLYNISYDDAKKIVHTLNLKSKNEWLSYHINNDNIELPRDPRQCFLDKGWVSWGEFLGTNNKQDNLKALKYISYDDAKKWVNVNITAKTIIEWKKTVKMGNVPDFIPNRPERYYGYNDRGWVSWGEFLGTGRIANQLKEWIPYIDAKKITHSLNIKSRTHWLNIYDKEIKKYKIPILPSLTYSDVWVSWGEFLGTGRKQDNLKALKYISYDDAKKWITNNLPIKSVKEWKENIKQGNIPEIIPNNPQQYFSKKDRGWKGWKDFLSKMKK